MITRYVPPDRVAAEVFVETGQIAMFAWRRTQRVAAIARSLAPRKTGKLRSTIKARKAADSTPSRRVYETTCGAGIRYAAPQEFGYTHWRSGQWIEGRHFMERAHKQVWS